MYNSYSYNGTGYNGVYNAGPNYYDYIESEKFYNEEDVYSDELKEHIKIDKDTKKKEIEDNEQNDKESVS